MGIANKNGLLTIPAVFDEIKPIWERDKNNPEVLFDESRAFLGRIGSDLYVLRKDSSELLARDCTGIQQKCYYGRDFVKWNIWVSEEEQSALIAKDGTILIRPGGDFDLIDLDEFFCRVEYSTQESDYCIIRKGNKEGYLDCIRKRIVLPPIYDVVIANKDFLIVVDHKKYGLFDSKPPIKYI